MNGYQNWRVIKMGDYGMFCECCNKYHEFEIEGYLGNISDYYCEHCGYDAENCEGECERVPSD